jgi:3-carboxy-cis,cis-muconate cycloisomerase
VTQGLEVDAGRMARNLDLTQGLVLAEAVSIVLAQRLGRDTRIICWSNAANARWPNSATCARCSATSRVTAELSAAELDHPARPRPLPRPGPYLGRARVAEHSALTA